VVCKDGSSKTLYMMTFYNNNYYESTYRKDIKISRNIYAADIILGTTGLATLDKNGTFVFFEANDDSNS
jgi:hypothetical protein